jgi:hypothetical protein
MNAQTISQPSQAGTTAAPPPRLVEATDLVRHADWLPPSAHTLVRVAGAAAALHLMQQFPGVQFIVPRRRDANADGAARWQTLAAVVGEGAMPAIVAHYAPGVLDVPTCRELLLHKRNQWIRQRFDALTAGAQALSAYGAAQAINLALAQAGWPMTLREVQKVVNTAPGQPAGTTWRQPQLPGIPPPSYLDSG